MPNSFAPPGTMFVCSSCGKTSSDKYGTAGNHTPGWDASCMLNSILVKIPPFFEIGDKVKLGDQLELVEEN